MNEEDTSWSLEISGMYSHDSKHTYDVWSHESDNIIKDREVYKRQSRDDQKRCQHLEFY